MNSNTNNKPFSLSFSQNEKTTILHIGIETGRHLKLLLLVNPLLTTFNLLPMLMPCFKINADINKRIRNTPESKHHVVQHFIHPLYGSVRHVERMYVRNRLPLCVPIQSLLSSTQRAKGEKNLSVSFSMKQTNLPVPSTIWMTLFRASEM